MCFNNNRIISVPKKMKDMESLEMLLIINNQINNKEYFDNDIRFFFNMNDFNKLGCLLNLFEIKKEYLLDLDF